MTKVFVEQPLALPRSANKPAAQAADIDPSQCNYTSRQNPPIQKNCRNFWTNTAILMPFKI